MNKSFSQEIIEIDGKEYTLFLNRAGIVLWEKSTKFDEFQKLLAKKYEGIDVLDDDAELVINEDTIPTDLMNGLENLDEDEEKLRETIIKFYWIALSKFHNLKLSEVRELMDKAENGTFQEDGTPNDDAYGFEQLVALMTQMLENANSNLSQLNALKNLKALKPTK